MILSILRIIPALASFFFIGYPFSYLLLIKSGNVASEFEAYHRYRIVYGRILLAVISFYIGALISSLFLIIISLLGLNFNLLQPVVLSAVFFIYSIILMVKYKRRLLKVSGFFYTKIENVNFLSKLTKRKYREQTYEQLQLNKPPLSSRILSLKNNLKIRQKISHILNPLLITLIIINILIVVFFAILFPIRFWDAISCWSLKAKAFFIDKNMVDFYLKHDYGLKGADAAVYLVRLEYIEFVKNFLDAARKCGLKRAVFISSTTALLPKEGDIKKTKLEAEDLIKRSGLVYTILRPSMIYGGAGDNNFYKMLNFIKKKGFFVIFGSGKNLIQPVHVDDVTDAILNVLDNPATHQKTYEICGREAIQFDKMLETVKRKLKRNFKVIKLPIGISKFAVNIYKKIIKNSDLNPEQIEGMRIDRTYSYSEAQKDFGFSPVSFEEGIEKEIKEIGF